MAERGQRVDGAVELKNRTAGRRSGSRLWTKMTGVRVAVQLPDGSGHGGSRPTVPDPRSISSPDPSW
jgi:hypothetical protein